MSEIDYYVEIKGQLDARSCFFYCKTHCLLKMFWGTIMTIIRSSRVIQMAAACGTWLFGLQVGGLVWSSTPYQTTPDQSSEENKNEIFALLTRYSA
jgi:hypothetical protein